MQYCITRPFIGHADFIEISRDEFEAGKAAKRNLLEVLSIEEKFNLVLENYAEFERELLCLGLNNMIFSDQDWFSFQVDIHLINRRLINFLTTCRLYIDHIPHNLSAIEKIVKLEDIVKKKMAEEYDSNLSYRVLEALRNYAQHRGLPVYGLEYRIESATDVIRKHTITPSLSLNKLKEEKKFKVSVLQELEEIGERIDLKFFIRQYVDSLGRVHLFLRDLLEDYIAEWDLAVFEVQKRFRETVSDDTRVLSLVARDINGEFVESVDIFSEIIEHRQWLVRKNLMLTHFSSEVISGEIRTKGT